MKRFTQLWLGVTSIGLALVIVTSLALYTSSAHASTQTPAAGYASSSGLSGNGWSLQVLLPTPGEVVTTPTLALDVVAVGYKLDAAFAGTPNLPQIGHYHEILDGRLVDMTPLHNPNNDT